MFDGNHPLSVSCAAETLIAPIRLLQAIHQLQRRQDTRHDDELCNLIAFLYLILAAAVVEKAHTNGAGIVGINGAVRKDAVIAHQATLAFYQSHASLRDKDVYACVKGTALVATDVAVLHRIQVKACIIRVGASGHLRPFIQFDFHFFFLLFPKGLCFLSLFLMGLDGSPIILGLAIVTTSKSQLRNSNGELLNLACPEAASFSIELFPN